MWTEERLREATQEVLATGDPSLVRRYSQPIPENAPGLILPQGGKISFGSTQPKKPEDARKVFDDAKAKLDIVGPGSLLHWFLSAEETSLTFTGNAYEKVEAVLDRVYNTLGYEKFIAGLKEQGIEPDTLVFLVNDCGAYLNTDYSGEPEFVPSAHKVGVGAWPGVETGPISDAQGGVRQFYSSLNAMRLRKEGAGEVVDLSGVDNQTYMAFKIMPRREDVRIFEYSAYVPVRFETTPTHSVAEDDVVNALHFIVPTDPAIPPEFSNKHAAEFLDVYLAKYGAESYALRAFLKEAQIPLSSQPSFQRKTALQLPTVFRIATQHNGFSNEYKFMQVPDLSSYLSNLKMRTDRYSPADPGAYVEMTKDADAVVLGYHSPEITNNWNEYFLTLLDMWCTFMVDKQVTIESFSGRPLVVINPSCHFTHNGKINGQLDWRDPETERAFLDFMRNIDPRENPWGHMINFMRYLHEAGFVKQEPKYLYDQYSPDDPDVVEQIEQSIVRSYPDRLKSSNFHRESYGPDRSDLCEMTVFGSASTWVIHHLNNAEEMGRYGIARGMHVRTGGGARGVMGAVGRGAMDEIEKRGCGHYSAIQMVRMVQFESCYPLAEEAQASTNKHLAIEETLDDRMLSLFRSDILVTLAGGIGSYAEIVRFMNWKEMGLPGFEDKKMIILNDKPPGGAGVISTFDVFLAMIPEDLKSKHLIIVNDMDSVKREVDYEYMHWLEKKKAPLVADLHLG